MGFLARKIARLTSRGGFQRVLPALLAVGILTLSGCHSPYVQADIHNGSPQPVSLLEVDYPSASFGKETLAAGADFHYRFKILGSGPTKVLWTDAGHKDHSVAGPDLHEGQQGALAVTITGPTATWTTHLQP